LQWRGGPEHHPALESEAREGVTGHNVRYVLIISVVGAAVVLAGLWFYYFA